MKLQSIKCILKTKRIDLFSTYFDVMLVIQLYCSSGGVKLELGVS